MRSLVSKLLCWMGLHEWVEDDDAEVKICIDCGETIDYD